MNEKHITFENLKTVISPVKYLIDKKADWNELKNRPFYTAEDGSIQTIDAKYIPFMGFISGTGENSEIFNDKTLNRADGKSSHAEGRGATASGDYSHAEGQNTKAKGRGSHAEGYGATAAGDGCHAEGYNTIASFHNSHAEGSESTASGNSSHAEGYKTIASGGYSHAEGDLSSASGSCSHAEGYSATASGTSSHAEGYKTIASGDDSHAEGYNTTASGGYSHAEGVGTIAKARSQHAQGEYNIEDPGATAFVRGNYAHIVGNGEFNDKRSNAHTLDWDGNAWFSGDVYIGSTSGTNKDEGSKKLATEEYVMNQIGNGAKGTPFVQGSGTTDSTAKTSTWVGNSDEITEYYDGLTIKYKIGVEGQSTVTLNINNLGAKTVYRFSTTKLTTQFPVGSIINLIYHTDLNDGCWITNDYDANTNTYQRIYESDDKNVEYPITSRYATTSGSSYYAEYGRYSTGVTLNPSKKSITATTFNGNLNGTATKATQDSHGNVIVDAYATKNYVQQEFASKVLTLTGLDAEGISHTWTIYGVAQ